MSSPDGTGAVGHSVADEAGSRAADGKNGRGTAGASGGLANGTEAADPWFAPGPKQPTDDVEADGSDTDTGWFLPLGRAGLLPESMTVSWESDEAPRREPMVQVGAAGSPPWAGDGLPAAGAPPPWENGPWRGPGDTVAARGSAAVKTGADRDRQAGGAPRLSRLPLTRIALAGGAAIIVLAVIIVVIVLSTGGGSSGGCATYPASVRHAYATAMGDLRSHAATAALSADLGQAASLANTSAAATGQISVRTALFAMAGDLDEAHADVTAHRSVPPALVQKLTTDGSALPASCPS